MKRQNNALLLVYIKDQKHFLGSFHSHWYNHYAFRTLIVDLSVYSERV